MTLEEIGKLLKLVVADDRRTVGADDITYWHGMLAPIGYADAVRALIMIRRRDPDLWVKPGHIWKIASTTTDGEAGDNGLIELPDCDHGAICRRCRLVHARGASCGELVTRPWPKAIGATLKVVPPVPAEDDGPPPEVEDGDAMEAERARQLAALTELDSGETA